MEKLNIFMGQERLGEIRIIDARGSMDLVYDPLWSSSGGISVSPHLLAGACRPESVHNFLANLLPEGEWLEDLSRNATCSKANIFGLITYIGTEACREFCLVPLTAVKNLLDWTLFQLIIGNSDAHGKNISFFVGKNGLSVAPAYDLMCLDLYQYDRELAMAIGDCFDPDDIATYQLAEMCEECKLPQRQTVKSLDALCDKTLHVLNSVEFFFPTLTREEEDFKRGLMARIGDNARRLRRFTRDLPKVRL